MVDEPVEILAHHKPITADDVDAAVSALLSQPTMRNWKRGEAVELGGFRWRPSAVSESGDSALYILLEGDLPAFVVRRMEAAYSRGMKIVVGTPTHCLFSERTIETLVRIEAEVVVLSDDWSEGFSAGAQLPLLLALAEIEVPVSETARRAIAEAIWPKLGDGPNHVKGKRLESLLAFVFSQVGDLKVVEHNFRSETDEIDLVLQINGRSLYSWNDTGAPFIFVEAKNHAAKADQQMVTVLQGKLLMRRGGSRLGILVSTGGFTRDARMAELRASALDICVVMIDGPELRSLLESKDLDEALASLVRRSLLR